MVSESTYNYLKNLKVEHDGPKKCFVNLGTLKNAYVKFTVSLCDKDGNIIDGEEKVYSASDIKNNSNKIYFESSEENNTYYKIIPTIDNGNDQLVQIQKDDPEKGNVVMIPMIQYSVFWTFEPYKETKKGFLSKKVDIQTAKMTITCTNDVNVKSGELCYRVNGLYYPIPAFKQQISFEIPGAVTVADVVAADNQVSSKYKIERRQVIN